MPEDKEHGQAGDYTRRSFLGKFALGIATLAAAGFLLKSFVLGQGKEEADLSDEFPGEDSIFHPRMDPRQEALERREKA